MSSISNYFESEWSFAKFRVKDAKTICAFGKDENTLVVLNADGTYYVASFNSVTGGDCVMVDQQQVVMLE
jgi:hypothetical protein